MIELDRHLEILLLDNDCVIVPGLGGFMTHHADSIYDEDDRLFLPPLRTLGFNPQLKMNDPLLAQSYAEAYDISYPEAVTRVEKEVGEMKEIIERKGSYIINDIGTLSLNNNGNYEFEPCESGILTPCLYGLSSFEFVKAQAVSPATDKPEADNKPAHSEQESNASTVSILQEEEETYIQTPENDKTISIRISVLRNIVAAAVAVIAMLLIPSPVSNSSDNGLMKGNIDTNILYRIMPKEVSTGHSGKVKVVSPAPEAETVKAENTATVQEQVQPDKEEETPSDDFYCIVLASRVAKGGAQSYVKNLHAMGYDEAKVLTKNNSTKVIYGRYKTESEAYNILNSLSDKEPFSTGWIFHVK